MNKLTPKQQEHQDFFEYLMDWSLRYGRTPRYVLEAVDILADYVGDIAQGRRK